MGSDGNGEVAERNAASDVRVGNEKDSTEGGESGLVQDVKNHWK